jgi:UDP-N-acetylmuramate--alanine ligase
MHPPRSTPEAAPRAASARPDGRLSTARHVHLVGIGGSGMSGLAQLLLEQGKRVSGSDARASAITGHLERAGARIHVGHAADQVGKADLVIISAAVAAANPEVAAARARGIPVLSHAEVLGLLVAGARGVAIAGTHGKTTTTALVGFLLERAGRDPTILAGSEMLNYGASVRLGQGAAVVVEADVYDRRFLHLRPRVAIVTGVEADHLDYYRDLGEIREAFAAFTASLPDDGLMLACADDPLAPALPTPARRATYGLGTAGDWRATAVRERAWGTDFVAIGPSGERAAVRLPLLGRHNVANALAALAVSTHAGVPLGEASAALADFRGTRRRFQRVGAAAGVTVIDDYAHHPTAVRVTLEAARAARAASAEPGPIWVVFQPHTRNRTARLLDEFAAAFAAADAVFVTPIYEPVGREQEPLNVSGADLAARIAGPPASYLPDLDAVVDQIAAAAPPATWVLTMGAGDVERVGPLVLEKLRARR